MGLDDHILHLDLDYYILNVSSGDSFKLKNKTKSSANGPISKFMELMGSPSSRTKIQAWFWARENAQISQKSTLKKCVGKVRQ